MFLLFIKQTMNRPINLVRGDRFLKQQRHFHQVDGGVGEIQSFCFLLILRDYRVTRRGRAHNRGNSPTQRRADSKNRLQAGHMFRTQIEVGKYQINRRLVNQFRRQFGIIKF